MKAKLLRQRRDCTVGKVYEVEPLGDSFFTFYDDVQDRNEAKRNYFEVIPDETSEEPAATTNVVIDGPGEYVTREGKLTIITGLVTDEYDLSQFPEHVWDGHDGTYRPNGTWSSLGGVTHRFDIVRKAVMPSPAPWDPTTPGPDLVAIRTFETGATRNLDNSKNDYEGFLSPFVIKSFGDYMTSHRKQKDGTLRDSDNWQKGIPIDVYMKSMFRHFLDVWTIHRGGTAISPDTGEQVDLIEALNAVLFNVQGMMHETLKKEFQK